jgi:quercetin dioxygenase-like cupin family protein
MFFNRDNMERQELDEGIVRYIYSGNGMQLVEYHFPPQRQFPLHRHESNEQMGLVISGRIGLEVDGQERILGPGDYYHAPVAVPTGPGPWTNPRYCWTSFPRPGTT